MRTSQHSAHAFDLLIDPEAVLRAVEGSSRLRSLRRKVCRPLDKLPPAPADKAVPGLDGVADDDDTGA